MAAPSERLDDVWRWAVAINAAIRRENPDAELTMLEPPYVFVATGREVTRYWMPETLGPVKAGPIHLRPPPANAPPLNW